jgi:dienelactone hydrolase
MITHRTRRTRAVALTAALAVALPLLPAAATAAAEPVAPAAARSGERAEARLALPRPTGPFAVGRDILHLVDHDRRDPWVPESGPRELMVSMYFPAWSGSGRPASYMTTEEARLLLESQDLAGAIPAGTVSDTRLTTRAGALPVLGPARPVLPGPRRQPRPTPRERHIDGSAALSGSPTDSPTLRCARAGGPPSLRSSEGDPPPCAAPAASDLRLPPRGPRHGGTPPRFAGGTPTQARRALGEPRADPAQQPMCRFRGVATGQGLGRYPLVVLSPGFSLPRTTLTLLAEELASRGYIVAAVDHAYESVGTAFPGGRVLTCAACELAEGQEGLAAVADGRAEDVSFVLDELTGAAGRPPAWRYAGLIDASRIGMAGHSIGGNSAAATMAADPRVRAGANLDGTFFAPVLAGGLDGRPFLMLGTEAGHSPGGEDESWDRVWRRLDGWKRWLTVARSGHFTFIDLPVLGAQLGITDPEAPLSGRRSGEITRDYVGAFFDLHLRGIPQPLLDGPSPANPEVAFHAP